MRLATTSLIGVLLLPAVAKSQDATPSQTDEPHNEIRKEMLSEYRYAPSGSKPAAIPTALQSDSPPLPVSQETKGDVVKMEPFEVRESGSSNAAYLPLERESPAKTPGTVASKLGIGEHDFKVGKVHAFVITIFYVPFVAGFSW
jgi:hypothetical protein